jgi:hypothetical protein
MSIKAPDAKASEPNLSQAAAALGRAGGAKGGRAKVPKGFAMLSPAQRKKNAQKANQARWAKAGKRIK